MRIFLILGIMALAFAICPQAHAQKESSVVVLETSKGDIVIEVNEKEAPLTAANFLQYVKDGFYDGTIFHRVIRDFMIQGGGMTEDFYQKETREPIKNEADNGLKNDKYTVAMARTNEPHSATSQFFINSKNNDNLNFTFPGGHGWGYCVFGKVVEGQDVVDAIRVVATSYHGHHQNVPMEAVVIKKAYIKE